MFYKETNFKETLIGNIPKDWEVVKIDKLFDLYKGTTPSTKVKKYWNGTIPFVTPSDITKISDMNKVYLKITEKCITEEGLKSKGLRLIPKNSLLFTSRATIGYLAINEVEVAINQGVISLIPKHTNVNIAFFYYLLQKLRGHFENLAGGSTYREISMSTFSNVEVFLPPLEEQQKIAEILSTIDEAIQKTNEIIAKTERLKKGLMQELLTKGIGHKEFKDTEIGKIPKEWEVVKLNEVTEIRSNRVVSRFDKVAFIPMELIPDSGIFVKYEVRPKEKVKSFTYCERGDLLLAKITPCLENGKQGIVPEDISCDIVLATTEVFPIHCKRIDKLFLFYVLKFPQFRNRIIASMTGTTGRQRASRRTVENLKIPLPPTLEQQKIAEILSTVDKKLEIERNEKARLERIKQGMMNLLLTGKIRVR